jgi:hypothetical protein
MQSSGEIAPGECGRVSIPGCLKIEFEYDPATLSTVIAREGGRSSIPDTPVINREAAAYWIPRIRGV